MLKNKAGFLSYIIHKNQLKNELKTWMVRPETVKLLQENIRNKLLDVGLGYLIFG